MTTRRSFNVFNEVAKAMASILDRRDPVRATLTIKPQAVRKSGKRARRAAFYHRARMCRVLTRIARVAYHEQEPELQERFRNIIVYGTSHPEMDRA